MMCRAGEEVTISYGAHSDAVFYLFYGFLPHHNPTNAVMLPVPVKGLGSLQEMGGAAEQDGDSRVSHQEDTFPAQSDW